MTIDRQPALSILGEELLVGEIRTILDEVCAEHLAIGRVYLRCEVGLGILQLIEGRHRAEHLALGQCKKCRDGDNHQKRNAPHSDNQSSEPLAASALLKVFCHISNTLFIRRSILFKTVGRGRNQNKIYPSASDLSTPYDITRRLPTLLPSRASRRG